MDVEELVTTHAIYYRRNWTKVSENWQIFLQIQFHKSSTYKHSILFEIKVLPNQGLSMLYGELTHNYGGQLSLYVPHMLRVNMTRDLAHLQLSDLQGEIRPICQTSDLQGERMLIFRT